VIYFIQYCALKALIFILNLLPLSVSGQIAKSMGGIFYFCFPKRRKIALGNLDKAYGDSLTPARKQIIARESLENTALSILELFLIKKIKKKAAARFDIQGRENLEAALAQGNGAILITTHLGSWEYLAFLFYLTGIPCSPIVKNIKNGFLDKEIDDLRREASLTPIPKKKAIRETLSELKKNHVVAVLIDQWGGRDGLWIDFFGTPTSTTSLPARLAKKTSCALVPAYCLRKSSGRYEILVLPALSLPPVEDEWEKSVTEHLNKQLEVQICNYPEQWSWGHRRWKEKPPGSSHRIFEEEDS
jgi:Kdo2-lipid IVA lauroyltransferase/acyltransferase